MNRSFFPLEESWASVEDMKQTPRTWSNYYGSALIETTLPANKMETKSEVVFQLTPSAAQLKNIQSRAVPK